MKNTTKAKSGKKLISADEATIIKKQHKKPCSDCPWTRSSIPGWLGGIEPEQWVSAARHDCVIECHAHSFGDGTEPQCAGASIFRSNVCKLPRFKEIMVLPANTDAVFSSEKEFLNHHKKKLSKDQELVAAVRHQQLKVLENQMGMPLEDWIQNKEQEVDDLRGKLEELKQQYEECPHE